MRTVLLAASLSITLLLSSVVMAYEVPTPSEINASFKKNKLKLRIDTRQIVGFYQLCADKGRECSAQLINAQGLTERGKALLSVLKESDQLGLNPAYYYTQTLEGYLADPANIKADLLEMEWLLVGSVLTYIRDAATGMPEVRNSDDNWLLKRQEINLASVLVEALTEETVIREALAKIEPNYTQYHLLKKAYNDQLKLVNSAEKTTHVTDTITLKKGMSNPAVILLRQRMKELGYVAKSEEYTQSDSPLFDAMLETSVINYQKNHHLLSDGVVGSQTFKQLNITKEGLIERLRINLDRWRWVPEKLETHHLVVEIPKFEYYIEKEGKEVMRAKTVVGMKARMTPVFRASMKYLVFSPYWNVPHSMAIKDHLPKLQNNPYHLARSGIRVFSKGHEVDPGMIDWQRHSKNNFPFNLRQDPGPLNALGRVKFMFPNQHAIYLHDTPQRHLFNQSLRARSSGCIRVENPTELAKYLLKDRNWDQSRIEKAYGQEKESTVYLSQSMQLMVYTLYFTTEVKDGELTIFSDIYGRDDLGKKVLKKLDGFYKG